MLYTIGYGIRADALWQDDVDEAVVIDFIVMVVVAIVKIFLVPIYLELGAMILIYTADWSFDTAGPHLICNRAR